MTKFVSLYSSSVQSTPARWRSGWIDPWTRQAAVKTTGPRFRIRWAKSWRMGKLLSDSAHTDRTQRNCSSVNAEFCCRGIEFCITSLWVLCWRRRSSVIL
ncbi:unnamed protein product [Calypogeia fissa]